MSVYSEANSAQAMKNRRIALVADSLLFTRLGGLQRQIQETANGLAALGIDVEIVSAGCSDLSNYDLAHVFDAESCGFRIVEFVQKAGIPVVLSPVVSTHWDSTARMRARWADRLATWITGNRVKTTYAQILWALDGAEHIIALGAKESRALTAGFGVDPSRITIVANGVAEAFFKADEKAFLRLPGIEPGFILNVGSIGRNKNQVTLAKAATQLGRQLVCIGPRMEGEEGYLDALLRFSNVKYLGPFAYDDERLLSAYATAAIFALPSFSEVMPLTVLESLAAGTPVIMTKYNAMDASFPDWALREIDPTQEESVLAGISGLLASKPSRDQIKNLVRQLTWDHVAEKLCGVYARLILKGRADTRH